jgi:hypothetical protein
MDSLFPTSGTSAPSAASVVNPPPNAWGKYRCTTSDDCAEQIRILRFIESRADAGATTEEIAAACNVSEFRLAPIIEWMIDRDAFLRWAFAPRGPIRTAVRLPTHIKQGTP